MNVLIVDDEKELRDSIEAVIKSFYSGKSISFVHAENGTKALDLAKDRFYDLILMDVKMPEIDGLTALKELKSREPRSFVVIMTAHSNLRDAVVAIREGAYDYLEKPLNKDTLVSILAKAEESREMVKTMANFSPVMDDDIESEMVSKSDKMKAIFRLLQKISGVESTVLIRGENGTGKELIAKAIHHNSPRKSHPFVVVNCAAIPDELIESELFGHERGAFTGAVERKIGRFQFANQGTLFLDEIGELKPQTQVKLLRFIQEKTFSPVGSNRELKSNARILAATNRNLEKMIIDGGFREDLFYRLNVMPVFIPPLRDRVDDIEKLVEVFIEQSCRQNDKPVMPIDTNSLKKLKAYSWPGNIRELKNVIERAVLLEISDCLTMDSIDLRGLDPNNKSKYAFDGSLDFEKFKNSSEKDFLINALKSNKGKINKTVANANIPKNTLLRKIKKYNIDIQKIIKTSS